MAGRDHTEQVIPENVIHRAARLPLVQSTYQILSLAYQDIKNVNTWVGYFCTASERGVKTASQVAAASMAPALRIVEPQIAAVNRTAVWMVDELQVRLPVLEQSAEEVLSDVRDTLFDGVRELRHRLYHRMQSAVGRAQALAKGTQDVVSLAAFTIGSLGVRELVKTGSEYAVSQAEELVDHYLPPEGEGDQKSVSSGETQGTETPAPGLVSRLSHLISTVTARSLKRVNPFHEQAWGLLYGGISRLRSLPGKCNVSGCSVLSHDHPQCASCLEVIMDNYRQPTDASASDSHGGISTSLTEETISRTANKPPVSSTAWRKCALRVWFDLDWFPVIDIYLNVAPLVWTGSCSSSSSWVLVSWLILLVGKGSNKDLNQRPVTKKSTTADRPARLYRSTPWRRPISDPRRSSHHPSGTRSRAPTKEKWIPGELANDRA
ncbi:perilipin-1-like [Pelodytes ibericus]